MKILNHPAVVALGIVTLYFLPAIAPLVEPSHIDIYHLSGSSLPIFLPVVLDLSAVWLLLTAMLWFAQRPSRLGTALWLGTMLLLPWIMMKSFVALKGVSLSHRISMTVIAVCVASFVALLLFWRPSFQSRFEDVRSFMATLLAFASLSGAVLLIQLLWFGWQTRALNAPRPLHQRQSTSASQTPGQRVIWIVLDELSYQQVYEKRFPGLELPAFDQLASEATVFTHVVPAGIYTHDVIPSLMTGEPIDHIRSSADGQLSIHNASSNHWQRFDPYDTVFQDALNGGYTTAIAGWYNPYCRIMSQVLDHCFWTNHLPLLNNLVADEPLIANIFYPMPSLLSTTCSLAHLVWCPATGSERDTGLHAQDYRDIFTAADAMLIDPSVNFMLLHLPVPHPGGIYDRKTSTFATTQSSYIDNLALADQYLAHVRQILQQHGTWDSSAIVVMGDHSWRTNFMWAQSPTWTAEDQAASHNGQFDDRPAYIVKMPQQQHALRIDSPFAAIHTRALLDGILRDQINSPSDLPNWATQQSPAPTIPR